MSELHCPARILVCSDPAAPAAAEALAHEHVARMVRGSLAPVVAAAIEDPRLDSAAGTAELVDELSDQFRGECVTLVVAPAVLASVRDLAGTTADRQVRVV